jgi:hypothetical protein
MYASTELNRRDLLTFLAGEGEMPEMHHSAGVVDQRAGVYTLVWAVDPKESDVAPNVLVLPQGNDVNDARDLLAFLWTYAPDIRPISANTRVLTAETFQKAQKLSVWVT